MGAEGIQGLCPWPGALADDAKGFAKQAIALYSDEEEWQHRQTLGYDILEQRFRRDKIGKRVLNLLESYLKNLKAHRRKNFIGQMLQHESMKATQYMSQWIEAKNQRDSD